MSADASQLSGSGSETPVSNRDLFRVAVSFVVAVPLFIFLFGLFADAYRETDFAKRNSVEPNHFLTERINREFGERLAGADVTSVAFPFDSGRGSSAVKASVRNHDIDVFVNSIGSAFGRPRFPYRIEKVEGEFLVLVALDPAKFTAMQSLEVVSSDLEALFEKLDVDESKRATWPRETSAAASALPAR